MESFLPIEGDILDSSVPLSHYEIQVVTTLLNKATNARKLLNATGEIRVVLLKKKRRVKKQKKLTVNAVKFFETVIRA